MVNCMFLIPCVKLTCVLWRTFNACFTYGKHTLHFLFYNNYLFFPAACVMAIILIITIIICIKSRDRRKRIGFSRLNFSDDEEEDDFDNMLPAVNGNVNGKLLKPREYRDYSSSDEESHELYDRRLLRR